MVAVTSVREFGTIVKYSSTRQKSEEAARWMLAFNGRACGQANKKWEMGDGW